MSEIADGEAAGPATIDPEALPVLTINLECADTPGSECLKLPQELHGKFTAPHEDYPGYGAMEVNVAVIVIPDDIENDWWNTAESKWMRQKVRRCQKAGYEFRRFEHNDHIDEIHEINTSLDQRQGAKMSSLYTTKPAPQRSLKNQPCKRHRRDYYGVFKDGKLYAYTYVLTCGEMMVYSRLLGHGDALKDDVMNLMVFEAAKTRHEESGTRYAIYHMADNGTEGLQFFKRKMGFAGHRVHWKLARPGVKVEALKPRPGVDALKKAYGKAAKKVPVVKTVGQKLRGLGR
jgi:hypothetical protein